MQNDRNFIYNAFTSILLVEMFYHESYFVQEVSINIKSAMFKPWLGNITQQILNDGPNMTSVGKNKLVKENKHICSMNYKCFKLFLNL